MDIEQQAKIIETIHDTLAGYVGQRLKVRANMGRSKIQVDEGVLTQVHPQLFVMELDRKRGRTARQSFSFADVLTGVVELFQDGAPLFGSFAGDEGDSADLAPLDDMDAEDEDEE